MASHALVHMSSQILHGGVIEPQMIRSRAAATMLGVSRQTIHRLIAAGELRGVRISQRGLRIPRFDLDRFMKHGLAKR